MADAIYRRKKNGSKAAWRTMLAAAPVQSTHLWTHVLVTVTASFRRVFEARRGRKTAQRHRSVSDSIPSEAIADPIDGMVGPPNVPCPIWCRGGVLHL